ncbi:MAG: CHASE3 domain-containing protein, partial [Pseudomonadota bacterium]
MRDSSPSRRLVKWADLSLTRKGLIVAALPLIILMGSLIALFTAFAAETRAEDELRRAFAIQRDMHEVHALLAEAGSGVREHLLTGNTSALEPFREAQAELPALLTRLDAESEDRD